MATMIAYEFPLAIIIISFAWLLGNSSFGLGIEQAFSFVVITANPIWESVGILGFIGAIILLLALLIVTPAELSKIPFDSPEAETEIAGGLLAEYSGRNLAMFYLTDAVKTVVMASIVVALFFPWNLSNMLSISDPEWMMYILNILFFLFKVFLVILFSVTLIRVAIARLKIDQIVGTYWLWITLLALVGLICIMWDRQIISMEWYTPLLQALGMG
jgi:formate hydrogenlyase subunit 4